MLINKYFFGVEILILVYAIAITVIEQMVWLDLAIAYIIT